MTTTPHDLRQLADRFSEGWHDGIKIDASDVILLTDAAAEIERLRQIAHLIGNIFVHGNFKAETYNERQLEKLLRAEGFFWDSLAEFEAALTIKLLPLPSLSTSRPLRKAIIEWTNAEIGIEATECCSAMSTGQCNDCPLTAPIRPQAAQPYGPEVTTDAAVKKLCGSLREDLDYAWTWHCNIAMMAFDAGCPHDAANEGAARFMQLLAGVDTRKHPGFAGTQTQPMQNDAAQQPAPAWHYAPTVPGLWICQQAYTGNMQAFEVTDPVALAMNLEIEGRWYGPIPMEDQT